jgi:probable F420-dependent oxidoreductase
MTRSTTTGPLVGVTLPLAGLPLHAHREAVTRLAGAGFGEVSTGEADALDGLSPLLLAGAWCPELTLSASVVSAFTRGPSILAGTAAALAEAAPGRARFGIGAGSDRIVTGWNGIPFDRPYRRVAAVLRVLRATLAGGRAADVPEAAAVLGVTDFRLGRVPEVPPALVVAALGPRMQRLAAAEADGVALNFLSAADVATVRAAAAEVPRRLPDPLTVQTRVFVIPGADPAAADRAARRLTAAYLTVPVYARFQDWLGRGPRLAAMREAWAAGDRAGAVAAVPEEVVHELFLIGSPAECAARVREYLDAGVHIATLALLPPHGTAPDPGELLEFLTALAAAL